MKLTVKWRYPNEAEIHEHTFYDINPLSVKICYGMFCFNGNTEPQNKSWSFQLNHVIETESEEE